jgi:hypothetical protein
MASHGQAIGTVGYTAPVDSEWSACEKATIRDLYRAGKLSLSAIVLASAKLADHGHAVNSGKVSVIDLANAGLSLAKVQAAYDRETSATPATRAKRADYQRAYQATRKAERALEAPAINAALIAAERDATQRAVLAKLAKVAQAKRDASEAAQSGRVLSGAEIAALSASIVARHAR